MPLPSVASVRRPIPLSQGLTAWVSPQDFRRVVKRKWSAFRKPGGCVYAQANLKAGGRWVRVLLHRFVMDAPAGTQVGHRNGDGLDCTRDNLRLCTHGQNIHNQKPRAGTSRFKGVSRKTPTRWVAQIMANRKWKYLGLFATEEEAARAYDAAAVELHGEFARLNFPPVATEG